MRSPKSFMETKTMVEITPTKIESIPSEIDHNAIGKQLTTQYQKAVSGMQDVLIFGAMLMEIRKIVGTVAHDRPKGGGRDTKGGGLKAWLEENAPDISRRTAYRFLGVAEGVALEYQKIVGVKVAKAYTLESLVTTPADQLPEPMRAKQLDLFNYVNGTTQTSWMDRFKARDLENLPGGDQGGRKKKITMEMKREFASQRIAGIVHDLRSFVLTDRLHNLLEEDDIELLRMCLNDVKEGLKNK